MSHFALQISTAQQRKQLIEQAQHRVIYCAPGITLPELRSLLEANGRLPQGSVQLYVDFEKDSFNKGWWGDYLPEHLDTLLQLDPPPIIAKHWRLGMLIVDDEAIVFSPVAQVLETEQKHTIEPNALRLDAEETQRLLGSIIAPKGEAPKREPITTEQVQAIQKEMSRPSASKPSQQRVLEQVRKRVKIVHFDVRGIQQDRRKLRLPDEVIEVLGSENQEINERLAASWKLFKSDPKNSKGIIDAQKQLEKELGRLKDKFLVRLGHSDFGLPESARDDFEKAWDEFQKQKVEPYRTSLKQEVGALIENSKNLLRQLLEERAKAGRLKLPASKSFFDKTEKERQEEYIKRLIRSVDWPNAEAIARGVRVQKQEYDITSSLLENKDFVQSLETALDFKISDLTEQAHEDQSEQTQVQLNPTPPRLIPFSLN